MWVWASHFKVLRQGFLCDEQGTVRRAILYMFIFPLAFICILTTDRLKLSTKLVPAEFQEVKVMNFKILLNQTMISDSLISQRNILYQKNIVWSHFSFLLTFQDFSSTCLILLMSQSKIFWDQKIYFEILVV